jgi:putative addiction module component (TIGR02574 family)
MNTQQLIAEAIELPVEERARLVNSVLSSLNRPSADIDNQWLQVVQRRLDDVKSGAVVPVAADEVFAKIWSCWLLR